MTATITKKLAKYHKAAALFGGMYAITAVIITAESGSILVGLSLGLLGSALKTLWALAHGWMYGSNH